MVIALIIVLGLVAAAADFLLWRRLRRYRRPYAVWAIATDVLPIAIVGLGLIVRDNPPVYIHISMWLLWAWIALVLPRMVCGLFWRLHLPHFGIMAAVGCFAVLLWGVTAGRTTLQVSRTEFCSPRIPAAFDGVRIVQFSDLHLGALVCPQQEIGRLIDSINALHPDYIFFTGDLVNIRYTELDARAMRLLQGLHAPVYSVTGNHDIGTYIRDTVSLPLEESLFKLIDRQREMGWHVLEDTTVYLHRSADSIALSGISFDPALRDRRHDSDLPPADFSAVYRQLPDSTFNITLIHLPQLWEQMLAAHPVDLTLTGHVHAMQVKLHLFGRSFSPAAWNYVRWSGRYDTAAGQILYINDGIGYVACPMRLGAYPEITLITLKRCE